MYYVSEELKKDKKVVLAAVKQISDALYFASEELYKNKEFLIECYRINKSITSHNNFIEEFDKLENNEYNNIFIKENIDILHLVENKDQLYEYLFENKEYDIIHKNEDMLEYIKNIKNIVVLSLNEIDPENEYDKDKLKEEYTNKFLILLKDVIFID